MTSPPGEQASNTPAPGDPRTFSGIQHRAGFRVAIMFAVFIVATLVVGIAGEWVFAPAVGWIAAAATYIVWVWLGVIRLGPEETARHATREDPTQPIAQTLLIVATLASIGAIGLLLVESGAVVGAARFGLAAAALATVAASWCLVQTLFTLRYAGIYYRLGGAGIDFNQPEPPEYRDFAYVAFTLGMTYQVSDTSITSSLTRRQVLRHAVLSFVLGVIVLAAAINLIAALAR